MADQQRTEADAATVQAAADPDADLEKFARAESAAAESTPPGSTAVGTSATSSAQAGSATAPPGSSSAATPAEINAARAQADKAREDAKGAWKVVAGRLSVARGAYNSLDASAKESYNKAMTSTRKPSRHFNQATEDWNKAALVEIPAAAITQEAELASVRGVAKEWLAAALALFSLFSFTALFFGDDTLKVFEDQSLFPVILFTVLTLGAVAGAVCCSFFGTRAAHGWPPKGQQLVDENGKSRIRTPQEKVEHARRDLKRALYAAGGTLVAIMLAVAAVLITQLLKPAPLQVKVMAKTGDIAITCGKYEDADDSGIVVTDKDGKRVTTPWSQAGKVSAVRIC